MALTSDYTSINSQEFSATFNSDYEAIGKLANIVASMNVYLGVHDNMVNVPRSGASDMVPLTSYQADIPGQNLTVNNVQFGFEPKVVKHYLGKFQSLNFRPNAIARLAANQATAVSRYEDHKIITALNDGSVTNSVTATSNLTTEKVLEAMNVLDAGNVTGKRFLLIHANQYQSLLQDTQFTSRDFTNSPPLDMPGPMPGHFRGEFAGFNIIVFGNVTSAEDGSNIGLPFASSIRTCFAFSDTSILYGRQGDLEHGFKYDTTNFRNELATAVSLGATPYDVNGICKIQCTES